MVSWIGDSLAGVSEVAVVHSWRPLWMCGHKFRGRRKRMKRRYRFLERKLQIKKSLIGKMKELRMREP